MDPNQLRNAASAMANMSPEQRNQMSQMFANMDPSMIANMSKAMGMPTMSSAQIAEAQKKMTDGSVDLSEAAKQAQQMADNPAMLNRAKQQQESSASYMLAGAKSLKEKGNGLFKNKQFSEAAECYRKAVKNLVDIGADTKEAHDLTKASRLNLAMCCLQMQSDQSKGSPLKEAESECTKVIKKYPNDLKGRYRRGCAREKLGNFPGALADLEVALKQAPADDNVKSAIERVRAELDKLPEDEKIVDIEEVDEQEPESDIVENHTAQSAPASGGVSGPGGMTINPEQMKMAAEMMKSMSPEDTEKMMKTASEQAAAMGMTGPGGSSAMQPEQMKMAAEMMKNMTPEQTASMMDMASKMGPMMGMGGTGSAGPANGPSMPAGPPDAEAMRKMTEELTKNPEMMKNMTNMMKDMDPEVIANMSAKSGMPISKEQAKQMTEQMKNITPETMEKLMKWGQRAQWAWGICKQIYDKLFGSTFNTAVTVAVMAYFLGSWLLS